MTSRRTPFSNKKEILKYLWRVGIILLVNLLVIAIVNRVGSEAVQTLSKVGSRGDEVTQIQTKLTELGYFSDKIDGIYGEKTKAAVVKFQQAKGLTADGIAGTKTLSALGIGASGGNGQYSSNDITLLARVISAESRGEPYVGQVAVGAVILNRVEHPSFPNALGGVIYQPGAFTAIVDGQINEPIADSAYRAARDAINGWDPSGGAIYYYNPDRSTNKWIFSRPVITVIGKHRFCS